MSGEIERVNGTQLPAMWSAPEALRPYRAEIVTPKPDHGVVAIGVGVLVLAAFTLAVVIAMLGGLLAASVALGSSLTLVGFVVRDMVEGRRRPWS